MIKVLVATRQRVLTLQIGVIGLSSVAAGCSFFLGMPTFIATLSLIILSLLSLKAAFYCVNQTSIPLTQVEIVRIQSQLGELSEQLGAIKPNVLKLAESSSLYKARLEAIDRDRAIVEKLPVQVAKIEQEVTWLLDNIATSGQAQNS